MITGFNTDIEHEGTVYHVQTEDKGLDTPLILSLVYVGGAILASKRSPYDDLIAKGFDERELADRLNRQHKLICAAIRAGRIDDLKRMSQRDVPPSAASKASQKGAPAKAKSAPTAPAPERKAQAPAKKESAKTAESTKAAESVHEAEPLELPPLHMQIVEEAPVVIPEAESRPKEVAAPASQQREKPAAVPEQAATPVVPQPEIKVKKAPPVQRGARPSVRAILQDVVADFARAEAASDAGLHLSLLDENEFRGGATIMLKIRVGRGPNGQEAINGADITVKVLGSTFRPLIFPTKTGADGVATVRTSLPHFKTGRAALLVRAIADGYEAELRRIIQQG